MAGGGGYESKTTVKAGHNTKSLFVSPKNDRDTTAAQLHNFFLFTGFVKSTATPLKTPHLTSSYNLAKSSSRLAPRTDSTIRAAKAMAL